MIETKICPKLLTKISKLEFPRRRRLLCFTFLRVAYLLCSVSRLSSQYSKTPIYRGPIYRGPIYHKPRFTAGKTLPPNFSSKYFFQDFLELDVIPCYSAYIHKQDTSFLSHVKVSSELVSSCSTLLIESRDHVLV